MTGVRERARRETMSEILRIARHQLATEGAPGVSLRAIAREMGMVSSAVYRYVASREDLLTLLIIESYEALGKVAERADASVEDREDVGARWSAICTAVRGWAIAHPADHGLIYGTPIPGYVAPPDTIPAALRFTGVLTRLLADAESAGATPIATGGVALPRALRDELRALGHTPEGEIGPELMARGLMAWAQLMGALGLELGGHLHNVIEDTDAWFEHAMATTGALMGIPARREPRRRR